MVMLGQFFARSTDLRNFNTRLKDDVTTLTLYVFCMDNESGFGDVSRAKVSSFSEGLFFPFCTVIKNEYLLAAHDLCRLKLHRLSLGMDK